MLLSFTLSMLFTSYLTAQKTADKLESNAEIFSETAGSFVQRGFEPIGVVARCKLECLHIKDLISGHSISALRFEGGLGSKAAIIDADEIAALISSIQILNKTMAATAPQYYTEVNFKSRSGFSAGAFFEKGKWTQFMKLIPYDSDTFITLSTDDMDKLLNELQTTKSKL